MKKTTPPLWWRKRRAVGTNVTKTAEQQAATTQTEKTQIYGLDKWTTPSERKRY
jgi:hypothetical protein